MNYLLWAHISNRKKNLSEGITIVANKIFRIRALMVPLIFIVFVLVYIFIDPIVAAWIPAFIPVLMRRGMKLIEKKWEKKYGNAPL